jgi:hypothetical protein
LMLHPCRQLRAAQAAGDTPGHLARLFPAARPA